MNTPSQELRKRFEEKFPLVGQVNKEYSFGEVKISLNLADYILSFLNQEIERAVGQRELELLAGIESKEFYIKHNGAINLDLDALVKVEDLKVLLSPSSHKTK